MAEFASAIESNVDKFNAQIEPIAAWYWKHAAQGDHPYKLAAETYVSIVGQPQLFMEGNHRTGLTDRKLDQPVRWLSAVRVVGRQRGRVLRAVSGHQTVRRQVHVARPPAVAQVSQVVSRLLGKSRRQRIRETSAPD